jgi:hypothetical protein
MNLSLIIALKTQNMVYFYGLFFLTAILAAGQNRQGTIKTDLNLSSSGNSLLSFK